MIATGTYRARGLSLTFSKSPEKGTECAVVMLRLEEGPDKGANIEWVGWLTEKMTERTASSLALMGYDGVDLASVSKSEVIAVIEHEEFTRANGEKGARARVAWINDPGGAGRFQQMSGTEVAGAKDRLRAAMTALKAKGAAAPQDEKLFG